jgi:HD-GYP domain-containing protein (c-di-GMP phosphodiesterase class II)
LPTAPHPLAPAFPEWTAVWSSLGLWLSLWDPDARLAASGGAGSQFWDRLVRHSALCRERLARLARNPELREPFSERLDPSGGALLMAIPLRNRNQPHGAVLACGLTPAFFDEETFARFCDLHKIDRPVFSRLTANLPVVEPRPFEALGRILAHQMQGLQAQSLASSEIGDLTTQLAQSYEELSLIYRISSGMNAQVGPVGYLQQICQELAAATSIESVVAVLEPGHGRDQPTVVRAGPVAASDQELLRLCRQAHPQASSTTPSRVFNRAHADPEFAWAAGWLRQFAFYDLSRKHRPLGALLAINRTDGQDLSSCEVQLLNAVADRSAAFLEALWLYDDLEHLFLGMLHALVSSIDAKDPYTRGHSQRVAWLSRHLASLAGLGEDKCRRVYLSGLLHDIGKIGVSESVLRKAGRLTPQELDEIKRHPAIGAHILENVLHVEDIIPGVLHHHERLDGRGYPAGLKGDAVPFLGRIIGLADCFDAMTTNRTYRAARHVEIAAAEIRRCTGTQFDPRLAELLLGQNLPQLHAHMTEFSRQSVRAQPGGELTGIMGGRL